MQPTPRPTTNDRLTRVETLLEEVHAAVVGDGQRAPMAERLATLEAEAVACRSFRRETYWRGVLGTLASFCVSVAASVGLSLRTPLT